MNDTTTLPLIGAALRVNELPQFIDWLAADHRDLEIQDPCYPGFFDTDWQKDAARCHALLESSGYKGRYGIHAVFSGVDLSTWDERIRAAIIERLRESLQFGAEIGATHAVIHSPFLWFGSPLVAFSSEGMRGAYNAFAHMVLEPLLPIAEQMGLAFVIETIADGNSNALVELVRSFDSPHVRLSIDTGHVTIMERIGGAPADQWVMDAGDLLGHVHLQDNDGHADRHWAIGEGRINWYAFFKALRQTNVNPRLILELNDVDDIMPSMRWLVEHGLAR
jgi:sugar phosphate isomerase/epimerase